MTKELIKKIIAENQQYVKTITLIQRDVFIADSLNYVFVGLRRAGKSYIMYQQIQNLLRNGHSEDEILYFNFEDERIPSLDINDLDLIKTSFEEVYNTKPIFFLDEIQLVAGWEKFARRLADHGYRMYVTGSNAKMLSSEIATTLGGRYMIYNVFPYSFREFLKANSIDFQQEKDFYKNHAEINKLYQTYFYYGGLPELMQAPIKREWLHNLYQKVVFGDILARYQIRNEAGMRVLVRKLAESVKQPVSYNRLANIITQSGKKIGTDTVIDYLTYLQDARLILPFENYVAKLADKESNKKYYFVDNRILNLFLFDADTSLIENQAAIILRKLYGNQVYYLQGKTEIDFYIPEQKTAIQVSYSINDFDSRKREISNLIALSKSNFEVKKYLIITKDEEESITEQGIEIQTIPVWKWLLNI
jgi:predicted AAA+ superfamily ATPase